MREKVKHLFSTPDQLSIPDKDLLWDNIKNRTHPVSNNQNNSTIRSNVRPINNWLKIAAAILLPIGVAAFFFLNKSPDKIIAQANSSNTKFITLADGSNMVLNNNAEVTYPAKFENDKPREVWLKGEAFFTIEKLPKAQTAGQKKAAFIVHTADVTVQVLGTAFDVKDEGASVAVTLHHGSIQLNVAVEQHWMMADGKPLAANGFLLEPGNTAVLDKTNKIISIQKIELSASNQWRFKKFIFSNTTVADIIKILEDKNQFGLKVKVENESILNKPVSGTVMADGPVAILKAIEATQGIEYEMMGNEVLLK